MPGLMPKKPDFVDESRLIRTNGAFVDFLAVVVVDHVLLEVSFVTENFAAESARDFVDNVRVTEVIFEHAL